MKRISLLLLLALTLTAGCDLLGGDDDDRQAVTSGVVVASQGVFGSGPFGTVTLYDPASGETTILNVGDFNAQSVEVHGERLYVTGGSGVAVYDLAANTWRADIPTGGTSSRYVAFDGDRAYVTDLYTDRVSVLDLKSGTRITVIAVGATPEGITVAGSRVYVANSGFGAGRTVSVINTGSNPEAQPIEVACDGPRFVFTDEQNEVYVVCTGNTVYDSNFEVVSRTDGAVVVLNGATGAVVKRFDDIGGQINAASIGQAASYSPEAQELYVVRNDNTILRFNTEANTRAGQIGPVTTSETDAVGAVAYDALTERLYVGHVTSYDSRSPVSIHDRTGTVLGQFEAGIIPTYITFRRK